jgi:hypothetical protein
MGRLALFLLMCIALFSLVSALEINQTVIAEVFPKGINLQIISPENNFVYSSRQVPLNLILGEENNYLKISDNNGKFRTFCRRCSNYQRKKPFDDGYHETLILVSNIDGESVLRFRNFTVDSKPPRIRKTSPRKGLTNGLFSIIFQEENIKELSFTIKNESNYSETIPLEIDKCEKEKKDTICKIKTNLSKFDAQKITYWFNITDILSRPDGSRPRILIVDFSPPKINFFDYTIDGRKVKFVLNITEKNFDKIEYTYFDNKGKTKRLCSRLKDGICEKTKRFRKGSHNLTIEIFDEAENINRIENIIFNIS